MKTRSEIQFGRVFSFYVDMSLAGRRYEPYYFKVTVITEGPIDPETGMSVDLIKLNSAATRVFRNQKIKSADLRQALSLKYRVLEESLTKHGIVLQTVQFDESRGLSVLVGTQALRTFRHDFAIDEKGVLYQVTSQFDDKNKLIRMKTKNLKLDIEELIIF